MRVSRKLTIPIIGLSLVTAMTGCAASSPVAKAQHRTNHHVVSSPTATPTPAAARAGALVQTIPVTDDSGYQFNVIVHHQPTGVTPDTGPDAPGKTALIINEADQISLQNTTTGRDISFAAIQGLVSPLDEPAFALFEGWNATSPMCTDRPLSPAGTACEIEVSFGYDATGELPAGATSQLQVYSGVANGGGQAGVDDMPEADTAALSALLLKPDFYMVGYAGGDNSRFPNLCGPSGNKTNGQWDANDPMEGWDILWSSTGQCVPVGSLGAAPDTK